MNKQISILTALFVLLGSNLLSVNEVYAYGSSSGVVCKKPVIKTIAPTGDSGAISVEAGSEFAFEVSNDAKQKGIKLSAKNIDMSTQINKLSNGKFEVKGNLPESLTEGYASVTLTAPAGNGQCSSEAKVLVQIN
ncbi:MAG: hypothetical protein V3U88_07865 [Methylococcales bacterium]